MSSPRSRPTTPSSIGSPARPASIERPPTRPSRTSRTRRAALGVVPTQETLVLERFFDESGGMQLVLHAPFGSRINKAWGLALRKRFCRQFNFELQAAATEDALLLSLGPQHSFPLADVFRYLHPATAEDVLVQALLDAPVFQTRWRWNTTISLAVPRVPRRPQGAAAAPADARRRSAGRGLSRRGGVPGEHSRRSPASRSSARRPDDSRLSRGSHGFRRARRVLAASTRGDIRLVTRDTPEPSPSRTRFSTPSRTRFWTTRRSRSGGRRRSTRAAPASRRPARIWDRSMRPPSLACATKSGPIRETPTNCTTR